MFSIGDRQETDIDQKTRAGIDPGSPRYVVCALALATEAPLYRTLIVHFDSPYTESIILIIVKFI